MNIIELSSLIQDERKCEDYLRQVGILKTFTNCIRCGSDKLGMIRRNRYKCYKCKAEWSTFRDSFLVTTNIECSKFLMAIKLFELEISLTTASRELNITRKTTSKIFLHIRNSIISEIPSFINNRIIKDHAPLFRIYSKDKNISITLDSEEINGTVAFIIGTRKKDSGKNVFYDYDCRYESNLKGIGKSIWKYTSDISNFWSYAIERLHKFNGTTIENYYSYLKELEFRFNNRNSDLFSLLLSKIAAKN